MKYSTPIYVPLVDGYEIVVTENEFKAGKLTGFTNHRFSVRTKSETVYTDIHGREWNVQDVSGYFAALRLDIPAMTVKCPPLAEYAKRILHF
jgi:hypothetical protein